MAPSLTFGTQELADAVHDAIEGHTAALMANHGTLAYGGDLATAATRTRLLEWVSTLYWRAAAIGTPKTLSKAEQDDVLAAIEQRSYGTTHGSAAASADQMPSAALTSSSRRANTRSAKPRSSQPSR